MKYSKITAFFILFFYCFNALPSSNNNTLTDWHIFKAKHAYFPYSLLLMSELPLHVAQPFSHDIYYFHELVNQTNLLDSCRASYPILLINDSRLEPNFHSFYFINNTIKQVKKRELQNMVTATSSIMLAYFMHRYRHNMSIGVKPSKAELLSSIIAYVLILSLQKCLKETTHAFEQADQQEISSDQKVEAWLDELEIINTQPTIIKALQRGNNFSVNRNNQLFVQKTRP